MAQTVNDLKEIAPGVFEGTSPKKGDVRRFIKLPSGLNEGEMMAGLEAFWGINSRKNPRETIIHLFNDLAEKNEKIGGDTYIRCLKTADVSDLEQSLKDFNNRLAEYQTEHREGSHK